MITTWPGWQTGKLLGEGSFGKVYEITREEFGVAYRAALKVITIPSSQSDVKAAYEEGMDKDSVTQYFHSFVEDIVAEFALMSQMKGNSNIVSYEDHMVIQHDDEIAWDILIRMELLTGLPDYAKNNPLTEEEVIRLGIHMARALELCRKRKILHRDIKPENIFVSKDGDFKLGDFGVARVAEKTISVMSRKGTYNYMAPEVYRGEEYSYSADIYSLGMVMYRFLNNNRVPFLPPYPTPIQYSDREKALSERMAGKVIPEPVSGSEHLKKIVLKACAYRPEERYISATELREDLEELARKQKQVIDVSGLESGVASEKKVTKQEQAAVKEEQPIRESITVEVKSPVHEMTVIGKDAFGKKEKVLKEEQPIQRMDIEKTVTESVVYAKAWWQTRLAGAFVFCAVALLGTMLFCWDYFYDARSYVNNAKWDSPELWDAFRQALSVMVSISVPLIATGHFWSRLWEPFGKKWKTVLPFVLLMLVALFLYGANGIVGEFLTMIGYFLESPLGTIMGCVLVAGIGLGIFLLRKHRLWNKQWVGILLSVVLVFVWGSMQIIGIRGGNYRYLESFWMYVPMNYYNDVSDTPMILLNNLIKTYILGMVFIGGGYLWSSTKKWCKWVWTCIQLVLMMAAIFIFAAAIEMADAFIVLPMPSIIGLLLASGAIIGTDKLLGKVIQKKKTESISNMVEREEE